MYFLFYPIPIKRNTNFYSITHLYVISIFTEITNYNKNISIPQKLNLKYINSKSGEKNNFVQLTPIISNHRCSTRLSACEKDTTHTFSGAHPKIKRATYPLANAAYTSRRRNSIEFQFENEAAKHRGFLDKWSPYTVPCAHM